MIKKVTIQEWLELSKKYKYFVIFEKESKGSALIGFTNSETEKKYWNFRKEYEFYKTGIDKS